MQAHGASRTLALAFGSLLVIGCGGGSSSVGGARSYLGTQKAGKAELFIDGSIHDVSISSWTGRRASRDSIGASSSNGLVVVCMVAPAVHRAYLEQRTTDVASRADRSSPRGSSRRLFARVDDRGRKRVAGRLHRP